METTDKLYFIRYGCYLFMEADVIVHKSDEKNLRNLTSNLYAMAYEITENFVGLQGFAEFNEDEYETEEELMDLEHEAIEDVIEYDFVEFDWDTHADELFDSARQKARDFLGMLDSLPRAKILEKFALSIIDDHYMKYNTCREYFKEYYEDKILNYAREMTHYDELKENEYELLYNQYLYICDKCLYSREMGTVEIITSSGDMICVDCSYDYDEESDNDF